MKTILIVNVFLIIFCIQCTSDDSSSTDPSFTGKYADVIIDIAHGGKDPGAISKDGTITEKDLVLNIGTLVLSELKKENMTTLLTRVEDKFISLKERVEFAANTKSNFILSLHVDMSNDTTKKGYISYVQDNNPNSLRLAEYIQIELNKLNILKDNGIETGPFYMLKAPPIPSVILELGYISNDEDLNIITDKNYQDQIAKAITKAIIKYSKEKA